VNERSVTINGIQDEGSRYDNTIFPYMAQLAEIYSRENRSKKLSLCYIT